MLNAHFVIRCSAASFAPARRMLKGEGPDSQIATLTPCAGQARDIRARGLPHSLTVRFVRVRLSTGEWEVLVTSLLDAARYPTADFLELYGLRWGLETFYGLLKTRLGLENFSGIGAEAVRQDFHAAVYLTGLEAILTAEAQTTLDAKTTPIAQTVNRAVSFNAIKDRALDLLFSDVDTATLCQRSDRFVPHQSDPGSSPTQSSASRNPRPGPCWIFISGRKSIAIDMGYG